MTTFCRPSKTLTFSCASDPKGWHNTDTGVNPWSMRMEFTGWKPVLLVTDCTDRCCRQIVETRERLEAFVSSVLGVASSHVVA
ncbi:MAG: hypothetical protein J5554_09980 [Paludibacteraceae bacterium]|nr:hypothetical protein [Paludibacteraceae bacterium]